MTPTFPDKISVSVSNFLTQESYCLYRIDSIEETHDVLNSIVSICNQQKIYDWLFNAILHGKPYQREQAQKLFEMGRNGWSKREKFVFLLLTDNRMPVACVDIKSANLEYAEVGYWCSAEHRGVMTNTVIELTHLAQKAGFRRLFGRTRKRNHKSQNVLIRVGFALNFQRSAEDKIYDFYEINLEFENK